MQFTIDFNLNKYLSSLQATKFELQNPQRLLASIGETLLPVNRERHAKGLNPDGSQWAKLKDSTLAKKKGTRILYNHGDLLSFGYQADSHTLRIGTVDKKAAWHHFGTGTFGTSGQKYIIRPKLAKALHFGGVYRARVNHPGVPSRKLVGFPDSDRVLTERTTADFLARIFQASASN